VRLYRCYAKINLTLEVLGRRDDGYHDLASLVHTISLADDLRVETAEEIVCRTQGLILGADEPNLVVQAAELLREWTRVQAGAELTLEKRIPVAAGLGGGSSDAAATLVGLNTLWGTHLRAAELVRLAAQLGSDVPFFVRGGAAMVGGRGEQLSPVEPLRGQWLTLAVPPHTMATKTAALYAALRPRDFTDGQKTREAADQLAQGVPFDLHNAFSRAARDVFPGLAEIWQAAEALCGRRFNLSGAGPTVFALASSRHDALQQVRVLKSLGVSAYAVRTVGHARASVTAD
jgi:4-diphosphocytidyl-2-C-methyl-D-erythritol kinase